MRFADFHQPSSMQDADIGQIVRHVLFKLHPEIQSRKVHVETDVEPLKANVDCQTIHDTIENLLQHAINCTPEGSELSITLIDGNYQWELEIADSSLDQLVVDTAAEEAVIPTIHEAAISRYFALANRLASQHGGEIQQWDCPQGGIANVLVVPKRTAKQSKSAA